MTTILRRAWIPVVLAALIVFPLVSGDIYYQNMLIVTFMLAIGASGWNIMGGYAGYLSLGNSIFIGLGAYTTGILAAKDHVSPFLGCLVGGLVAAVAAAALSLVTRRTRGMYFVIVTFAALQLVGVAATTVSGLTGGSQGLALPLPTWSLSYQDWPFYYPMLGLLVVTVAVSAWVRRSKLGLGLFAIRDDEDKAAGLGLRTAVYKMIAFVLGGTFVGIAGGIYA
jgi:branched-chain amino acid transport system permease protein